MVFATFLVRWQGGF